MAKKTVLFRIQTSKAGKMYAEATTDVQISKGERFAVLDPRQFLNDSQIKELEAEGKVVTKTPSGKDFTIYASLFAEVARFED
jgi:hypothetical protein